MVGAPSAAVKVDREGLGATTGIAEGHAVLASHPAAPLADPDQRLAELGQGPPLVAEMAVVGHQLGTLTEQVGEALLTLVAVAIAGGVALAQRSVAVAQLLDAPGLLGSGPAPAAAGLLAGHGNQPALLAALLEEAQRKLLENQVRTLNSLLERASARGASTGRLAVQPVAPAPAFNPGVSQEPSGRDSANVAQMRRAEGSV